MVLSHPLTSIDSIFSRMFLNTVLCIIIDAYRSDYRLLLGLLALDITNSWLQLYWSVNNFIFRVRCYTFSCAWINMCVFREDLVFSIRKGQVSSATLEVSCNSNMKFGWEIDFFAYNTFHNRLKFCCILGGSVKVWIRPFCISSFRVKLILASQEVLKISLTPIEPK